MSKEILEAIDRSGKAFDQFKEVNDARLKAIEEGNESKAVELQQKLDKIEMELKESTAERKRLEKEREVDRERIEDLEARARAPGRTMEQKLHEDYLKKFISFARTGMQDDGLGIELRGIERKLIEMKDITIGTPAAGGFAVPEQIASEVERQEQLFSPVMEDIGVTEVGTSDWKELVNLRGAAGGWAGETTDRTAGGSTATPTLREVTPTNGEQYAWPQASEWSLDDIFFDVGSWLAEEIAETFAIDLAQAVVDGNGTNRPTGMLNTSPTTVDDFGSPLRAAAVYQYIATAVTSPPAVAPDTLIDLVYKLNSRYRAGAKWIMNSATTGSVRKLKDGQNQYLWQPGLQAGEPDRLLGYPHSTWEQMPDIATNAWPIGFGNLPRAYRLVRRVGMRVTRDDVTNPGYVRFYVRRRVGGIVRNNNALKFLQTA